MKAQPTDTMTISVSPSVQDKLAELARQTQRSTSLLAGEAITDYVDRELAIIAGIQRGLDDMHAGRVSTNDDVMAEVDAIIAQSKASRKAG